LPNIDTTRELAEIRQAIRDLYQLERRFKNASFERTPMPALEKILAEQSATDAVLEERPA
jgi:hypothetical protein